MTKTPKRIVLEDTGERRYPKDNEPYLYLGGGDFTVGDRLNCNDNFDGEYGGTPEQFAIYRIARAV